MKSYRDCSNQKCRAKAQKYNVANRQKQKGEAKAAESKKALKSVKFEDDKHPTKSAKKKSRVAGASYSHEGMLDEKEAAKLCNELQEEQCLEIQAGIGDMTARQRLRKSLLKINSCNNRCVSPYIEDFVAIWRIHDVVGIEGMYGTPSVPKYVGIGLYWFKDVDDVYMPVLVHNQIYDAQSNARIASGRRMQGWKLNLYQWNVHS